MVRGYVSWSLAQKWKYHLINTISHEKNIKSRGSETKTHVFTMCESPYVNNLCNCVTKHRQKKQGDEKTVVSA